MSKQPDDLAERQKHPNSRKLLTCKYYNGAVGPGNKPKICKAGVAYREHVGGEQFGWLLALPCLPVDTSRPRTREVVPCDKREFPSLEEIQAKEKEFENYLKYTIKAIALCKNDAGGKVGISGNVVCPVCNGNLQYSVSELNGHMHGQCKTPNCLMWME